MAALVAAMAALCGVAARFIEGSAWYETTLPCLAAGAIFIAHTRWALRKVAGQPMSAVNVMMSGIAIHFGVIVAGGLGLIFLAGFEPLGVFLALLAAFVVCQPVSTLAIRRAIFAGGSSGAGVGAATMKRTHFAEGSA